MSELIQDSRKRKDLLKHMIKQLHSGEAPEAVRLRLINLLGKVPYDEVVEVEQQLISEGMPTEEILKLCDIHTQALQGALDSGEEADLPGGIPPGSCVRRTRPSAGNWKAWRRHSPSYRKCRKTRTQAI